LSKKRLDVAVKWRYFNHLIGGNDNDAEHVYQQTILARNGDRMLRGLTTDGWKLSLEHWIDASKALLASMQENGFAEREAIPLDKHGEILNGSHRLACSLALGFHTVPTWRLQDKEAWAPEWGLDWFKANEFRPDDIERIVTDFEAMCGKEA
jgi:hypothetical protein